MLLVGLEMEISAIDCCTEQHNLVDDCFFTLLSRIHLTTPFRLWNYFDDFEILIQMYIHIRNHQNHTLHLSIELEI